MEEFNLLICGQILLLLLTRRRWHRARVPLCADRCRYREHLAGTSTNQHYLVPEYLEPRADGISQRRRRRRQQPCKNALISNQIH